GIGGDHGTKSMRHEAILRGLPVRAVHPTMVEPELEALLGERLAKAGVHLLGFTDCGCVDHADTRRFANYPEQPRVLDGGSWRASHLEAQVGTCESCDAHQRVAQAQVPCDV